MNEAGDVDLLDVEMSQPGTLPKTLNVFGVTHLSTKEILAFISSLFSSLNVDPEAKVEWIDDDSCNVAFPDDAYVDHCLIAGTPIEGSTDGAISIVCPPTSEGGDSHPLRIRRANETDSKNPRRSWRESKYYKKRLEENGINPVTLKPATRVILKPREGARLPLKPSAVTLIPRRHLNQAKTIIFGDEFHSKHRKNPLDKSKIMEVDEEELKRREDRAKRFAYHN